MSRKCRVAGFAGAPLAALVLCLVFSGPAAAKDLILDCKGSDGRGRVVFDFEELGIEGRLRDRGDRYEVEMTASASVHRDRSGRAGATICDFSRTWLRELPIPATPGKFIAYKLPRRLVIRNVPDRAIVRLGFSAFEIDRRGRSVADFARAPGGKGDVTITLRMGEQWAQSMTGRTANRNDVRLGERKRLTGDGRIGGPEESFRAYLDFVLTAKMGKPVAPVQRPRPRPEARTNSCKDYARRAVNQNRVAENLGCGFKPPMWSSNAQMHFDWCMRGDNHTRAHDQTLRRASLLQQCRETAGADSGGGEVEYCTTYANTAMDAIARTKALHICNTQGPRWTPSFRYHYDFCMSGVPRETLVNEADHRRWELERCGNMADR